MTAEGEKADCANSRPPRNPHQHNPGGDSRPEDEKRVATVRAQLALAGFATHQTRTGGWLIARWDRSHYAAQVDDLELFLARVVGTAGEAAA